jgi:hypothetical protein
LNREDRVIDILLEGRVFMKERRMKRAAAAVAFAVLFILSLYADTCGSLSISGVAPLYLDFSAPTDNIHISFNVDGRTAPFSSIIATEFKMRSNAHWKVVIESKNSGFLVNYADPMYTLPYTVSLGMLASSPISLSHPWSSDIQEPTSKPGCDIEILVQLQTDSLQLADGQYEDYIAVSIQLP